MPTLIEKAASKGWTVKAGTLQAKGLWHAFKEPIKSDDDVTVWCESANDAAREALKMQTEQDKKANQSEPMDMHNGGYLESTDKVSTFTEEDNCTGGW